MTGALDLATFERAKALMAEQKGGKRWLEWEPFPPGLCLECLRRDTSTLEDADGAVLLYVCENCGHEWEPFAVARVVTEFRVRGKHLLLGDYGSKADR